MKTKLLFASTLFLCTLDIYVHRAFLNGCCWRANVWIPVNYVIYHGLRYYEMYDWASTVAHYTEKIVKEFGNREYFNSETGEGCGLDPFLGWSLLGHFMDFEETSTGDITLVE